jgi:hypothetical protein
MDELRYALHAAVADPPPTAIDLDRLIDRTRRRTRLQYATGIAAGALAVVTGAVLVPMGLAPSGVGGAGGSGPPGPCPQVTPTTTYRPDRLTEPALPSDEPCEGTQRRLLGALTASLHAELPGWTLKNDDDPSRPPAFYREAPDTRPDGYVANVQVSRGSEFHIVLLKVSVHAPVPPQEVCREPDLAGTTCAVRSEGDVVATKPRPDLAGSSGAQIGGYTVVDVRPDGTTVTLLGSQALTLDRLIRIARTPGLTLSP